MKMRCCFRMSPRVRCGLLACLHGLMLSSLADGSSVRLLVKWKDGPDSAESAEGNGRVGATLKRNFNALGWQLVELPAGLSEADGLKTYGAMPSVGLVEPDRKVPWAVPPPPRAEAVSADAPPPHHGVVLSGPAPASVTPNDPRFSQQWHLKKIGAPEAWATTTGSTNVVVAVFDFDVDTTHLDLAANIWQNPGETGLDANGHDKATNGRDDDGDGYVDDVHGVNVVEENGVPWDPGYFEPPDPVRYFHGTFVTGLLGAVGNNGTGIAGVNWSVKIMVLRVGYVGEANATADLRSFTSGRLLAGWDYVIGMKRRGVNVRVASHSEGLVAYGHALREAILTAGNEGILTVVAADNNGINHDVYSTYANVQNLWPVMYVAASDSNDRIPSWSDSGQSTVHLAAPGVDMLSTTNQGGFFVGSGTSASCPLVAGTAALLLAQEPSLTVNELKAAILGSVDHPIAMKGKTITGGRLNVARALDYLQNPDPPAIVITALPAGQRSHVQDVIQVTFNRGMERGSVEAAFKISPEVGGLFQWSEDGRSLSFQPQGLWNPQTTYAVRVLASAKDLSGGTLDGNFNQVREGSPTDDYVWTFRFPVPNDDFANAATLSGESGSVQGTTRYALAEDAEPVVDGVYDLYKLASVWYRWTSPAKGGWFNFDLGSATAFDSYLTVFQGDQLDTLVTAASNDNFGARISSRVAFQALPGTRYAIAVIGKDGLRATQWGPFTLSWYPTPAPGFTGSQFSPVRGMAGAKVVLTGTNFTGATAVLFGQGSAAFNNALSNNLDLRITAVVPPDAASGPITVVTPHGSVTSTATFQVLPPPLSIAPLADGDVEIRWAATSEAMVLEEVEDLTAGGWRPVGTVPERAEGQSVVRLAPTRPTFYRLKAD